MSENSPIQIFETNNDAAAALERAIKSGWRGARIVVLHRLVIADAGRYMRADDSFEAAETYETYASVKP